MNLNKIEKSINDAFANKEKIDNSDKALNDLVQKTIDLLDAGKHLGMQSSVLRNASHSIRPDIPIPKQETGPWNKSTIEPDQYQVQMELGQ